MDQDDKTQPHPPWEKPDDLYAAGPPPWDIGRPQPAFLALAEAGSLRGRVLDAGCGTGEHTLMAAGLGLDATGIDLAGNALETARGKARERGLNARFLRHDALRLPELGQAGERFDTVLDCGLLHTFGEAQRSSYLDGLPSVLPPGGRYFTLCFSDRQPGEFGRPHKFTRAELAKAFAEGWRLDSLEAAVIAVNFDPAGVHAWLLQATRL
jgi:cyclopropane fatty-acyl-phospholipid synthase-like methyltransferase